MRVLAALVVGLLLTLASCENRRPDREVVILLGSNPANLDPRLAPDAFSERISRLIFSTLLSRDDHGALVPHAAARWEQVVGGDVVVHLRPDLRFHDDSTLDSADVVATFRAILDERLGSIHRASMSCVRSVVAVDPLTVRFVLSEPQAPFGDLLATVGIVRAEDQGSPPSALGSSLVGSGPFRFLEFVPGDHVGLVKNEAWWGGAVGPEAVRFRVVPDATVRVLSLLRGEADLLQNDVPPHVVARLQSTGDLRVETSPSSVVKYLAFNLDRPATSDLRSRQAIALGIDRDAIVKHRLRGLGVVSDGFLSPRSWAFAPGLPRWRAAPEQARQLLSQRGLVAGRDGKVLRLVLRTSMDDGANAVARVLRRQLAVVGVDLDIQPSEWGQFLADINRGEFDLFTLSAVGVHDPDWYRYVVHSASIPPAGGNRARYRSAAVDALLDLGRRQTHPTVRKGLYGEVQRIVAEDLPILPLWHENNVVISGPKLTGYRLLEDADFSSLIDVRKSPL